MKQGFIAIALLGMLLQGCYYGHRESNTQQPNECYIMFVGNLNDVSVSVDEQEFVAWRALLPNERGLLATEV